MDAVCIQYGRTPHLYFLLVYFHLWHQMIAEAIKSGTVSLDNPNVRSLLESCAANGIGTTGLNTKNPVKKSASAEGVAGAGAGAGGRKSPEVGGKKSSSSSSSPGGSGQKKAVASKTVVSGNTGNGSGGGGGKKKTAASSGTPAAAANGDAKKSGGGGGKGKANAVAGKKADTTSSGGKGDAGKGGVKSPKASAATSNAVDRSPANSSGTKAKRAPTKSVGKPGLDVPETLFPELVRMIEKGGGLE